MTYYVSCVPPAQGMRVCAVVNKLDWRGLDHWRGIVWDPGIVDKRCLHACYDCLCFIALFCT